MFQGATSGVSDSWAPSATRDRPEGGSNGARPDLRRERGARSPSGYGGQNAPLRPRIQRVEPRGHHHQSWRQGRHLPIPLLRGRPSSQYIN
jgi:hypothetical protein